MSEEDDLDDEVTPEEIARAGQQAARVRAALNELARDGRAKTPFERRVTQALAILALRDLGTRAPDVLPTKPNFGSARETWLAISDLLRIGNTRDFQVLDWVQALEFEGKRLLDVDQDDQVTLSGQALDFVVDSASGKRGVRPVTLGSEEGRLLASLVIRRERLAGVRDAARTNLKNALAGRIAIVGRGPSIALEPMPDATARFIERASAELEALPRPR